MIKHLFFDVPNLYIDWQLGNVCNYNCYYCNDESKSGNYLWPDLNKCKSLVREIVLHSEKIHQYRTYNLLGGEPTVWNHFGDLCSFIKQTDPCSVIQVLTNGSKSLRWWNIYKTSIDKVVISYHASRASVEHIIEVANSIKEYNSTSIQVLMDVNNFEKCQDAFYSFVENVPGVKVSAKKGEQILGMGKYMNYTPEQELWLNKSLEITKQTETVLIKKVVENKIKRIMYARTDNGTVVITNKEIINSDQNKFKGFNCKIGIDMLSIKANGNITPSSACFNDVVLGNYLINNKINWIKDPFVCKYDRCFCGADIEIEKYR